MTKQAASDTSVRVPTNREMILLAAGTLPREGFTVEDLSVACWKRFPKTFGLDGYRDQFPASNRVSCKIMGSTGLIEQGWLQKDCGRLTVSDRGWHWLNARQRRVYDIREQLTDLAAVRSITMDTVVFPLGTRKNRVA